MSGRDKSTHPPGKGEQIMDKKVFTDPDILQILAHEKNQRILSLLIEEEMTIIDLKNETNLNPGTIKRHLNQLIESQHYSL